MRAPGILAMTCAAAAALGLAAHEAAANGFAMLEGHGGPVMGLAGAPDGTRAASAGFDYAAGVWDLRTDRLIRWLEGHDAAVNDVAFSPDGTRIVTAGDDGRAIIWDARTGAPAHRLDGHRGKVRAARFSPDGSLVATAGWDGRAGLWSAQDGRLIRWLDAGSSVNDVAFSGDGALLWTAAHDGRILRWSAPDGRLAQIETSHGFGVNRLAVAAGAGWLAYGAVDGGTRVLDIGDGSVIADITLDRRPILALALDAGERRLAVGDGDGYIMVLDTSDWTVTRDFRAVRSGPVWALAWAGGRLLSGGLDPAIPAWPQDPAAAVAPQGAAAQPFHKPVREMSNGERQFVRKCSVCHELGPPTARKAGPSLRGVFGRVAGALPGYAYSQALRDATIVWTDETIDLLFREGPERVTPGSKMPMQRIARPEDRADLIAFLRRAAAAPPAPN